MLTRRIIPCLDVANGRVVKGLRFTDLKDAGDPVECAKRYEQQLADEIVILDITASNESRKPLLSMIEKLVHEVFIPVTVGGGISSIEDVHRLLNHGADKISINSAAVHNPKLITQVARDYGSQCVVVAIDAQYNAVLKRWEVYTEGGRNRQPQCAIEWAKTAASLGAGEILLTSMDQDGTQNGFDLALTRLVATQVPIQVIASGGVGTLEHLYEGLEQGCADAVLAASIFHFHTHTIVEAKRFLSVRGVPVRLPAEQQDLAA